MDERAKERMNKIKKNERIERRADERLKRQKEVINT